MLPVHPTGHVAIVLHAHLPYVRHPEWPRSLEERWLFEALWESYLPLIGMLDRLAQDGIPANLTLSVSPTLLAMLGDDLLKHRFEDHLLRLDKLAARAQSRLIHTPFLPALDFYRNKIHIALDTYARHHKDVVRALTDHARSGHIQLCTTTVTHAYLPGLLATPASIRAQLRLGRRAFSLFTHMPPPPGFWLPECAYDPAFNSDLAHSGIDHSLLDAHAFPRALSRPVRSPGGVTFFARDVAASHQVWSNTTGYPAHPDYREFYQDIGFTLPESDLESELGPFGTRLMTGLKLHRITDPGPHKAPYDPDRAYAQAERDATDFVMRRRQALAALTPKPGAPPPVLVAAYDAELFGHFWLEGPVFLEHVLRKLATAGCGSISLGKYLDDYPADEVVQPLASSWGAGGFGSDWMGPRVAWLWRHLHHAERRVRQTRLQLASVADKTSAIRPRATAQAIRELLLLQASDWPFMITHGQMDQYAKTRIHTHLSRIRYLTSLVEQHTIPSRQVQWLDRICQDTRFLAELPLSELQTAFDPW